MAQRNNRREAASVTDQEALDSWRSQLAIDRNDLDESVARQPELFDHVADAFALATAERDAAKHALEDAIAEEDIKFRRQLIADREKEEKKGEKAPTETAIMNHVRLIARVQTLQRELMDANASLGRWLALKEAFRQRKDMLQELVPLLLSRLSGASITRPMTDLAESNRARAGAERRVMRQGLTKTGGDDE